MKLAHNTDRVLPWLMEGDPAIRWQALRDLAGAPASVVERERSKVARHGWGAARLDRLVEYVLAEQMPDGGWNCQRRAGATHASVHTTISALEGLHCYELHRGRQRAAVRAAQRRGREFLLVHRLFRSHRTGKVIKPLFLLFSFPPRWHYDILRALDYFQAVSAPRDPRLTEAIEIVRSSQREDGRWPLQNRYKG